MHLLGAFSHEVPKKQINKEYKQYKPYQEFVILCIFCSGHFLTLPPGQNFRKPYTTLVLANKEIEAPHTSGHFRTL